MYIYLNPSKVGWALRKNAILALEDGTVIRGSGFGAEGEALGELVFATGMTGYPESLTDPSYNGQILMNTYPLIGNYNVHPEWFESDRVWAEGFVVRELCDRPYHWRGTKTVDELLREFGVPGISGVDTRALTIKIRGRGTMKCGISVFSGEGPDVGEFLSRVREQPSISEQDLASETAAREVTRLGEAETRVVLIDCGVKRSIVRNLLQRGVSVVSVPPWTKTDAIESLEPDGIVISNAPGDPARLKCVAETVAELIEDYPMMGICMGNQLLALAAGGRTFKLRFGHRGVNQPVKDLVTGRVHITSQNHNFAVDPESLEGTGFEVRMINLNDGTVEAIEHRELPVFGVQYHPEASPGPRDNLYLFDMFTELLRGG
jgi:carbamoyl-phosphate synthase small subunit